MLAAAGCGASSAPEYRLLGLERKEVIVREFAVGGPEPDAPLGRALAATLADTLQSRGILASVIGAATPPPAGAHALVDGRLRHPESGTLSADARLLDLDRRRVVAVRHFREHSPTLFGEAGALRRDVARLGRDIAVWLTEEARGPSPQ